MAEMKNEKQNDITNIYIYRFLLMKFRVNAIVLVSIFVFKIVCVILASYSVFSSHVLR